MMPFGGERGGQISCKLARERQLVFSWAGHRGVTPALTVGTKCFWRPLLVGKERRGRYLLADHYEAGIGLCVNFPKPQKQL